MHIPWVASGCELILNADQQASKSAIFIHMQNVIWFANTLVQRTRG